MSRAAPRALRPGLGALLGGLLLALPAAGQEELQGLWRVEGELPGGQRFSAHAALSPQSAPHRYTIEAVGARADGEALRWRATAVREGDVLRVRHWRRGGLADLLPGGEVEADVTGRYALNDDEAAFGGSFGRAGQASGRVRYVRSPLPEVSFGQASAELRVGERLALGLVCEPPGALLLLDVAGADDAAEEGLDWEGAGAGITLEGVTAGVHRLEARLGRRGPALATLEVVVRSDVVERVVARAQAVAATGALPLVVFDLDDTLFDTRDRTLAILQEWGADQGEARLAHLERSTVVYRLEETLRNAGFSEDEVASDLGRRIRRAWSRRFFGDDAYHLDGLIPGAVELVARLEAAGARVVYVTGRKAPLRDACLEVLAARGFPADPERLFLKPLPVPGQPRLETAEYKERVARDQLPVLGVPIAAFDNEPSNCNAFRRALPADGIVVWLDTLYEPDAPPLDPGIETVLDLR